MRHKMLHTGNLAFTHHCSIASITFILLFLELFPNCRCTQFNYVTASFPCCQHQQTSSHHFCLSLMWCDGVVIAVVSDVCCGCWLLDNVLVVVIWLFMPELLLLWLTGNYYWFHDFLPYCMVAVLAINSYCYCCYFYIKYICIIFCCILHKNLHTYISICVRRVTEARSHLMLFLLLFFFLFCFFFWFFWDTRTASQMRCVLFGNPIADRRSRYAEWRMVNLEENKCRSVGEGQSF